MIEIISILLRIAGAGLIILAIMHIPIARQLKWREDSARMAPANASIFHVHAFFICLAVTLMGLPCLIEPRLFLKKSRAGLWISWSLATFWATRLYFQFFVYKTDLWRGKRMETALHYGFSFVWLALTLLFGACGCLQAAWMK